ncbi:hypothetical protein HDZ31DRAFT_30950 [Schizophyllum fasciatum]
MDTAVKVKTELDLDDWMKDPHPIEDASLPLRLKHKLNLEIEASNDASREITWRYKADPLHYPHLGAPIKPLYAYTLEECEILLHDKGVDWKTLPSFLRSDLSLRLAESAKVTSAQRDGNTLKLNWLTERPATTDGSSHIPLAPPLYRAMLLAGCRIPLSWFSDKYLDLAHDVSGITTKNVTLLSRDNKLLPLTFIDVEAMIRQGWPDDVERNAFTFTTWKNCFDNLIRVCTTITCPRDVCDCHINISAELVKHYEFFCERTDALCDAGRAEQCFAQWYSVERELRLEVLRKRVVDHSVWNSRAGGVLRAAEAACAPVPAPQPYHNPYNPHHGNSRSRSRKRHR